MLSPFEIQEMAHFLPHLGHAYDFVLQRLSQKRFKNSDVDSHSVPMDMDVPKPETIDTDAIHSLTEEFEELFSVNSVKRLSMKFIVFNRNCVMDACLIILAVGPWYFSRWLGKESGPLLRQSFSLDLLLEEVKKEMKKVPLGEGSHNERYRNYSFKFMFCITNYEHEKAICTTYCRLYGLV